MKKILHNRMQFVLLLTGFLPLLSSCLKKSDAELKPSVVIPFTGTNLVQTLAEESSLRLFYQAFTRLSLAGAVDSTKGYTIFAPTDSAMNAAGLTAAVISSLSVDSLRSLITLQITLGAYNDEALSSTLTASELPTLRSQVVTAPNGGTSLVYTKILVKQDDGLFFNGIKVAKQGATIQASNGYLYKTTALVPKLPVGTIYDVIQSDPDLSMYRDAIAIADSVRIAATGYDDGSGDVTMFSTMPDVYHRGMVPTVLAPTNKAFHDAGFNTTDDLIALATRYYVGPDLETFFYFNYSSLDSVLKHHIIYNAQIATRSPGTIKVFYSDMVNGAINNNVLNNYLGGYPDYGAMAYKTPLVFSATNGNVSVRWNNDPASVVALPRDASPEHPVNNFVCANGALYKVDKLFSPAVK